MAEEHRCEAPEGHRLCANNCGFFGSPATLNLCSKCYRDISLKEEQASSVKSAVEKSLSSPSAAAAAAAASSSSTAPLSPPALTLPEAANEITAPGAMAAAPSSTQPSRCSTCRKRVGLTGFRCRCGITFCGVHRYPEQHGCTFDFKKPGKEAISKANPVVKADKLHKI